MNHLIVVLSGPIAAGKRFDLLGDFSIGFNDEGHGEEFAGFAPRVRAESANACDAKYGIRHFG